jgi:heme/copper-type cytochrome/quinol oxidase subunit 2
MSDNSLGELYFIIGMMVIILILCVGATYIFIRQYKREKSSTQARQQAENMRSENEKEDS